jgi:hypothetical protein
MKSPSTDPRSTRILAKTLVRDLRRQGWDAAALVALATELLGLVAADARARRVAPRKTRVSVPPPAQTRPSSPPPSL